MPGIALQSALISDCLPGFLHDHAVPFLDPHIPPRLWTGNRVTTPVHFDAFHNLAVVTCGRRRFTLFAPEGGQSLHRPSGFRAYRRRHRHGAAGPPDDQRFPHLHHALEHSLTAELQPGDAICIPPLWWHHVESLQALNALVNYWWKAATPEGRIPDSGLGSPMHAILALKSLSPAERAAWKVPLDHYAFNDEDPAAHIPVERRGMLGTLTPEQVEQKIRQFLQIALPGMERAQAVRLRDRKSANA